MGTAAAILRDRFYSRHRYRRVRDFKIAVEWIGRIFTWLGHGEYRLVEYHPDTHIVKMVDTDEPLRYVVCSTDQFWSELRKGKLLP